MCAYTVCRCCGHAGAWPSESLFEVLPSLVGGNQLEIGWNSSSQVHANVDPFTSNVLWNSNWSEASTHFIRIEVKVTRCMWKTFAWSRFWLDSSQPCCLDPEQIYLQTFKRSWGGSVVPVVATKSFPFRGSINAFDPNPSKFLETLLEIMMDIKGSHPMGRLSRPAARLNFKMQWKVHQEIPGESQ